MNIIFNILVINIHIRIFIFMNQNETNKESEQIFGGARVLRVVA